MRGASEPPLTSERRGRFPSGDGVAMDYAYAHDLVVGDAAARGKVHEHS